MVTISISTGAKLDPSIAFVLSAVPVPYRIALHDATSNDSALSTRILYVYVHVFVYAPKDVSSESPCVLLPLK
jgi:hypothetical protein